MRTWDLLRKYATQLEWMWKKAAMQWILKKWCKILKQNHKNLEWNGYKNVDLGERKMKPSSQNPALVQPRTILRKGPKMVSLKDFKSGREQCRNTFFFVRRHAIWYDIHTEDGLVFIPDLRGSLGPLLFLHFLLRENKMRKRKPTSAPNDARTLKIDHPTLQIPCVQWSKARRVKEWS